MGAGIFLSAAWHGMESLVGGLAARLDEAGYQVVHYQEGRFATVAECGTEDCCLQNLPSCDAVIAVLETRYGSLYPDGGLYPFRSGMSNTWCEIIAAKAMDKPLFVYVKSVTTLLRQVWKRNRHLCDPRRATEPAFDPWPVDDTRLYDCIGSLYRLGVFMQPYHDANDLWRRIRTNALPQIERRVNADDRWGQPQCVPLDPWLERIQELVERIDVLEGCRHRPERGGKRP